MDFYIKIIFFYSMSSYLELFRPFFHFFSDILEYKFVKNRIFDSMPIHFFFNKTSTKHFLLYIYIVFISNLWQQMTKYEHVVKEKNIEQLRCTYHVVPHMTFNHFKIQEMAFGNNKPANFFLESTVAITVPIPLLIN